MHMPNTYDGIMLDASPIVLAMHFQLRPKIAINNNNYSIQDSIATVL